MAEPASADIRVWDAPTRLFHWLLVALFAFSWWSAENHKMDWHRVSGLILVGLILFRLIWGFIGGSTARFVSFVRSPREVFAYVRGAAIGHPKPGHNPLGAYSVVAMLLVLLIQLVTGLFSTDTDGLESGPLSYLVSFDQSRLAAKVHHLSFNLLLALIGLHVLSIAFYLVARRRNLIAPMITGVDAYYPSGGQLRPAGRVRLVGAVLIAAALALWAAYGFAV